ncbi:hypothetical protein NC653_040524 [Populus alba x Populus x berolinensis]|uniref:Uncharacterized protein n=1 Tax=Populus alba x Populus x berolinensis TaxID=444605 RepID=A0AAD6L6F4_9ROSI|nr:hypothetical protein NC653_040524 [Populus alba x Populus x berolinensis]
MLRWKVHIERKRLLADYGPTEVTFNGKFGKSITIQNFLWKWPLVQEEKRKMVASAFGKDQSGGSATCLTVEDLKYLYMV